MEGMNPKLIRDKLEAYQHKTRSADKNAIEQAREEAAASQTA